MGILYPDKIPRYILLYIFVIKSCFNHVSTPCNITYFQLKFLFLSWSYSLLLELAFHIFHYPICSRLWSLMSLSLLCCTLSRHLLVRICHFAWWGGTCYHHLSSYTMILASWVWHIHWHWQLHQNLLLTYIMVEDLLWPLKEKSKNRTWTNWVQ